VFIDPKDLHLMSTLIKRGDEHAKVVRGIMVYAEINAPRYWWQEMDTYRIGTDRLSSESTMHIQGKLNKAQRKGLIKYHNNQAIFVGTYEQEQEFLEECKKELGDICWAVAGFADKCDWTLDDVMQGNLDKLADRHNRGVIDGKGDNR
jgi:hypothetical protein